MTLADQNKGIRTTSWVFQVVVALAFIGMGALPKLMGMEPSPELFDKVGQPWARIPVGLIELTAAVLLLVPKTIRWGALLAAVSMVGAIGAHLATPLGTAPVLTVEGKAEAMPEMMMMAIVFLVLSSAVFFFRKERGGTAPAA